MDNGLATQIIEEAHIEALLEELIELETKLKPMAERIQEIKSWCRERGTFSTEHFVCMVQNRTQRRASPVDKLLSLLGDEAQLLECGILQMISFQVVNVSRKELT